ncbi:hypothetical protein HBA55_29430 [Pseudomaricurvus alkylphenolicus]|uniref:hypothetical protein n=1 Tax=Pseudomaricurvus alkylphenolicus TaxID=1306991 RepID=UPI0014228CFF|nr:hypothetical protein [Pseudomaricurvus alkylphenolicus]NIB43760.1 hypothetical protein [Pseudomaricurvus alkylphenolicus]
MSGQRKNKKKPNNPMTIRNVEIQARTDGVDKITAPKRWAVEEHQERMRARESDIWFGQ